MSPSYLPPHEYKEIVVVEFTKTVNDSKGTHKKGDRQFRMRGEANAYVAHRLGKIVGKQHPRFPNDPNRWEGDGGPDTPLEAADAELANSNRSSSPEADSGDALAEYAPESATVADDDDDELDPTKFA